MTSENCCGDSAQFPLRPLGDRFVVKVIEKGESADVDDCSGFLVAKGDHSKPMKAVVIEISDRFSNEGLGLKVGDEVLLPKYGSTAMHLGADNTLYYLCNRLDLIGIL